MAEKNLSEFQRATFITGADGLHISQDRKDKFAPFDLVLESLTQGSAFNINPVRETTTRRRVTVSDRNAFIKFTSDVTASLRIVSSEFSPWNVGDTFVIRKEGRGDVVVSGAAGVVINPSVSGTILTEAHQTAQLIYLGNDQWDMISGGVGGGSEASEQLAQNTLDINNLQSELQTTADLLAAEEINRAQAITAESEIRASEILAEKEDRAREIAQEVADRSAAISAIRDTAASADEALSARLDQTDANLANSQNAITTQGERILTTESRLNEIGGQGSGISLETLSTTVQNIDNQLVAGLEGAATIENLQAVTSRIDDTRGDGSGLDIESLADLVDTAAVNAQNASDFANASSTDIEQLQARMNDTAGDQSNIDIESLARRVNSNTTEVSTARSVAEGAATDSTNAISRLDNTGRGYTLETLTDRMESTSAQASQALDQAAAARTSSESASARLDDTGNGESIESLASGLLSTSTQAANARDRAEAAIVTAEQAASRLNDLGGGVSAEAVASLTEQISSSVGEISSTVQQQSAAITNLESGALAHIGFNVDAGDSSAAIDINAQSGQESTVRLKADRVLIDNGERAVNLFNIGGTINEELTGTRLFVPSVLDTDIVVENGGVADIFPRIELKAGSYYELDIFLKLNVRNEALAQGFGGQYISLMTTQPGTSFTTLDSGTSDSNTETENNLALLRTTVSSSSSVRTSFMVLNTKAFVHARSGADRDLGVFVWVQPLPDGGILNGTTTINRDKYMKVTRIS